MRWARSVRCWMIRQRHHTNCNDGAIAEQSCWPAIPTQHGSIVLNYNSPYAGVHGRRRCKLSRRRCGVGNRYCRRWPDRNRQIFYQFVFMTLIRWQRWRDNTKQEASLAVSSRRGSTRRPEARLPPAHTALVGPVHSQNGGGDHFVRSWVVLTRQISSCAIKLRPYRFFLQRWAGRYAHLKERVGPRSKLQLPFDDVGLRVFVRCKLDHDGQRWRSSWLSNHQCGGVRSPVCG